MIICDICEQNRAHEYFEVPVLVVYDERYYNARTNSTTGTIREEVRKRNMVICDECQEDIARHVTELQKRMDRRRRGFAE